MSTAFSSCFLRGADADTKNRGNDYVRDVVSDYEGDKYPPGGYIRLNMPQKPIESNDSPQRYSGSLQRDGNAAPHTAGCSRSSGNGGAGKNKTTDEQSAKPVKPQTFGSLSDGRSSRLISSVQRSARKKWYNDSDEEEEEERELLAKLTAAKKKMAELSKASSDQEEGLSSDLDSCVERPSAELSGKVKESLVSTPSNRTRAAVARNGTDWKESVRTRDSTFDGSGDKAKCSGISAVYDTTQKETNVSRLSTKSQASSLPVVGTENELDRRKAKGLIANTVAAGKSTRDTLPTSKQSVSPLSAGGIGTVQPTEVQTGGFGNAPTIIINRRTDRLKHSAGGSEYSGSPRVGPSSNDEVLSPGPRKVPGAFPGRPGSGVLLEGWLRLKQRRGIKGLKKWNSRYFVLHAKSNEVRYYADVVQSAWGTIPLGELGSISLRLIQRIGKLSHPRYKGCHFDITCRNTWGTHCIDDYISSDDEDGSSSNVISANTNGDNTGTTPSKQEKGGTPRSTRVYSLVADSPHVTVAWVNMLDSLLTRSANSPRPEVGSPIETTNATPVANVSVQFKKPVARQRWSALDTESSVLLGLGEIVPRATVYAMNFIFDSTPGIETAKFYELEPDSTKLKIALKFLNGFAGEDVTRKPTKADLKELLDAVTAGAVIKLWLKQLQQPLIPFTMYADFKVLAHEAQSVPFDLRQKLGALLEALPKKNLYVLLYRSNLFAHMTHNEQCPVSVPHSTMLACVLFHLNDVNVYSSKNGMDAARLALHFAAFVLRPPKPSPRGGESKEDIDAVRHLVTEMIINVDTFMDEKEAQLLEDNQL